MEQWRQRTISNVLKRKVERKKTRKKGKKKTKKNWLAWALINNVRAGRATTNKGERRSRAHTDTQAHTYRDKKNDS